MPLPQLDSLDLLNTAWPRYLNPLLSSPLATPTVLQNVILISGITNTVNHLLGKELTGWIVIRQGASSNIWDTQESNPLPDKTLQLHCSSNVTVNLLVF